MKEAANSVVVVLPGDLLAKGSRAACNILTEDEASCMPKNHYGSSVDFWMIVFVYT
jgi:hypothetical protein